MGETITEGVFRERRRLTNDAEGVILSPESGDEENDKVRQVDEEERKLFRSETMADEEIKCGGLNVPTDAIDRC